ncbi:peptidylprolyl isomerase [Lichenicoccus roseus]|uniref:Parvulin-like PPIase n=1 Tax=Lichenicoccus roseus TaxID=2683649 RepID=A0A5R9JEQ7_9PROT|nr:SurA N-terminal domain-containing protein [Lichenicoccus roseus]TLU73896.1 peptidylprolyl isomerase [Lichenicoccus roseus]
MITYFRHLFVDSWAGRAFAVLIFAAFVLWGVGDFFTKLGGAPDASTVAAVGDRKIGIDDFNNAFHAQLDQVARQSGGDASSLPQQERAQVAMQVLQGLVSRAEALREATRLGLVVPDDVLRQTIFDLPLFKGPDGQFQRSRFDAWLQQNRLTEARVLSIFRDDLTANALVEPLRVGAKAPAVLVRHAYDFAAQTRTVDLVSFPFAAGPAPAPPDQGTLQRYYDNHPQQFQAPEYRRVKLVLLSPQTIARSIDVPEADERALFRAQNNNGSVPEKRSVQVITAPSEARAQALATLWRGGAGWPQMQAAATDSVPVALDDAARATFPSPEMGSLAFGAKAGEVAGPLKTETGWVLLKVTKVDPAVTHSFADSRQALHDQIAAARVRDLLADRVQKLQDVIAGGGASGSGLDQVPADLGAVAAEGTLDAQGMTQAGEPAPLPGTDAQRQAIIATAFAQKQGAPPELKQGPDDAEYALSVEQVTPAAALPFAAVQDRVRDAVVADARRRQAEQQAATLFAAARKAGGLAKLPAGTPGLAGLVHQPPFGRSGPPAGVPPQLRQIAFSLKVGQSTMVPGADGFVVATVTGVQHPDPASNRMAYDRLQANLDGSVANDIEVAYATLLRGRKQPTLNAQAIRSVVGP